MAILLISPMASTVGWRLQSETLPLARPTAVISDFSWYEGARQRMSEKMDSVYSNCASYLACERSRKRSVGWTRD